jgi:hypothetical protein
LVRQALVRSEEHAGEVRQMGALPVLGNIYRPETWIAEVQGSTALIDLMQPRLPKRLSRSAVKSFSAERQAMQQALSPRPVISGRAAVLSFEHAFQMIALPFFVPLSPALRELGRGIAPGC